jgi:hypothetical protein
MKNWKISAAILGLALFVAGTSLAQDNTQPGQGQGRRQRGQGGAGGGGNFDPAQFRAQQMARIKEALGATDEEFTALQPKLEVVMTAQRDTRGGFGGGRGGPGGRRGGQQGDTNAQPQTPPGGDSAVAKAQAELRTVLDNKDSKPEEIKAKLTALRDAREKAKTTLAAAQKDLKDLLTQRQEAVLVNMGYLD